MTTKYQLDGDFLDGQGVGYELIEPAPMSTVRSRLGPSRLPGRWCPPPS